MKTTKTIYSFDFDNTLFFSPTPDDGKEIYERKTGNQWPYIGWWSKAESLDTELFHVPINPWVKTKYDQVIKDENSIRILATGRLEKVINMRKNIEQIVSSHGLCFDKIYLNTIGDTFLFKTKLFTSLIKETKCDKFVMYDDRHLHIKEFREWAKSVACKVEIVDVINKIEYKINF